MWTITKEEKDRGCADCGGALSDDATYHCLGADCKKFLCRKCSVRDKHRRCRDCAKEGNLSLGEAIFCLYH